MIIRDKERVDFKRSEIFFGLFLVFLISSLVGFIHETLFMSYIEGRFVERGFLKLPLLPIYGFGSVLLLLLLKKKTSFGNLFFLALIICSITEYVSSYFLELFFHQRWWDYSSEPYHLNGRICLWASLCFGIAGAIIVKFVGPLIMKLTMRLNKNFLIALTSISITFIMADFILVLSNYL